MSSTYVTKLDYLEETKDLIKQAIIDKGVSVSDSDTFRDYAEKIAEIETGGGGGEIPRGTPLTRDDFPLSNAVKERRMAAPFTFYDYDGTVLGQYTKAQIDAMTSEDDFPTPVGSSEYPLTFVGWNWTLDELKAEPYGINVGAIYAHILDDETQSPCSVFMDVTEEVTFSVGNSTYGNSYNYFSIYNRLDNNYVIEDQILNVVTSITLQPSKYMLTVKQTRTSSSLSLNIGKEVAPYIKGICCGDTYYGDYTNPVMQGSLFLDFLCWTTTARDSNSNLSYVTCKHFNDGSPKDLTSILRFPVCETLSVTTRPCWTSSAGYLTEIKLPTNSNIKVGEYTTNIHHTAQADKLTEIYIPSGAICEVASNTIEAVYLEDGCKEIVRLSCPKVTELYLNDNILLPPGGTWYCSIEKLRLPEASTKLYGIPSTLKDIYLPDSLIEAPSFSGCTILDRLYIPDTVTKIPGNAFKASALTPQSVRFPENISFTLNTSSGSGLFCDTPTIDGRSITQFSNITSSQIYDPFRQCEYIIKVPRIPDGITNLTGTYYGCRRLKGPVEIPDTVTKMNETFRDCQSLIGEIIVPSGVTELNSTFHTCYKLQSVILPEGLTKIGSDCFNYCQSLTTITIPSTVTNMNASNIFYVCESLVEYHMKPTTPPTLSSYAFGYGSTLPNSEAKIYVPYSEDHSILAAYQSATNWSKWAKYIVEEEI